MPIRIPSPFGPDVRTGQGDRKLTRAEFGRRWRMRFDDPAFDSLQTELSRLEAVAWDGYDAGRKSPRTRPAGEGFADPEFDAPVEWLETRARIQEAQAQQERVNGPSRALLICGSPRTDESCPGEMSKSHRLLEIAREELAGEPGWELDVLDLSDLTSEYGRTILPCKGCVSTAMPLCHGRAPATRITGWAR